MNTKAFVLNKEDYDKKLAEAANIFVDKNSKQPLPYVEVGKKLYTTMGCAQCHSINGAEGQGPTWKGLYKRDVEFSKSNVPGYTLKAERRRQEVGRLPPRVDPPPGGQDRAGIPERHASPGVGVERIAVQREEARGHHRVHQEPGRSQVLQADEDAGIAGRRETARRDRQAASRRRNRKRRTALPIGRPIRRSTSRDSAAGREEGGRKMIAKSHDSPTTT